MHETFVSRVPAGAPELVVAAELNSNTRSSWYVVALFLVCYTFSYIDRQVLSLLVEPLKASMQLSDLQIGMLQGVVFAWCSALAGIPLAILIDRGNRMRVASICVLCWSLATSLGGLSVGFVTLALSRSATAFAEAGLVPSAVSIFSDLFPGKRVVAATTTFMIGAYAGPGLALLLAGVLIQVFTPYNGVNLPVFGEFEAWRAVLVCVGLPGLVLAPLVFATVKEPLRHEGPVASLAPQSQIVAYLRAAEPERIRFFALYAFGSILLTTIMLTQLAWVPAFVMREFGTAPSVVGLSFGPLYFVTGICGALLSSVLARGVTEAAALSRVIQIFLCCALVGMVVGSLIGLASSPWQVIVLFGVSAFLSGMTMSLTPVPIQLLIPNRMRGRFTAAFAIATALVGGLGPFIAGALADANGRLGGALTIVCTALACGASVFLWRAKTVLARIDGGSSNS